MNINLVGIFLTDRQISRLNTAAIDLYHGDSTNERFMSQISLHILRYDMKKNEHPV